MKKFLIITTLVLLLSGCSKDNSINEFSNSYKNFNETMADFYAPVLVANLEENPDLEKFNTTFSQIINSLDNNTTNYKRLELAEKATSSNNSLITYLKETYEPEGKANDALIELNRNAASIKDNELREYAIEIADICKNNLDNVNDYRATILEKREMVADLLQNIIDENGKTNGFNHFLTQEENQIKIQNQNIALENLPEKFNEISNKRETTFARFEGLAEIKN